MKRLIVLVAHDVRSAHNVGSLLRTADGLGVFKVYLTGYTPYPAGKNDARLPHLAAKQDKQITKTSLGAEKSVKWEHTADINGVLATLKSEDFEIVALEQTPDALVLHQFTPGCKVALVVGNEVDGLDAKTLAKVDKIIQIPMLGAKESFNVAQVAAMALYHLQYSVLA